MSTDDRSVSDVVLRLCRDRRHSDSIDAFVLRCSYHLAKNPPPAGLPADLEALWGSIDSAVLFEDVTYGQWGLRLLDHTSALAATKNLSTSNRKNFVVGDLVVGEFLGDSDLVIVRTDKSASDFGHVIISDPIDRRADWYSPANNFRSFLLTYVDAEGSKFWEIDSKHPSSHAH